MQHFDVDYLTSSMQVDTLISSNLKVDWAYSEVGWDHHAFDYSKESTINDSNARLWKVMVLTIRWFHCDWSGNRVSIFKVTWIDLT